MSKIENAKKALEELIEYLGRESELEKTLSVRPKFRIDQEVWVLRGDCRPFHCDKIEDAFHEVAIEKIIISRKRDAEFGGCALYGGNTEPDEIIATYHVNRYYQWQSHFPDWLMWESKEEAIAANQEEFEKEAKIQKAKAIKEKAEKKKRLQAQLKSL